MFKFVLMTGVFLGSLAGISGAVQAVEERGLTEQVQDRAPDVPTYQIGDRVWMEVNIGGGATARKYGTVINTAYGGTSVCIEFDDPRYNYQWFQSYTIHHD